MTVFGQNRKKGICKQLLIVGILLFTIATAGITRAQSTNARSDQAPDFAIGKLKKDDNWQIDIENEKKYSIPPNAQIFRCDKKEIELSTSMKGEQVYIIFKEIETTEGKTVKKVDRLYLICK